jgi:hypothetical protein
LHPEGGFFRSLRGKALGMPTVNVNQCHIAPIAASKLPKTESLFDLESKVLISGNLADCRRNIGPWAQPTMP